MLGSLINVPKIVTVKIQRASGLTNPNLETKKKKHNSKWLVSIKGGRKKMHSETVNDPSGNPSWDYEITFKIVNPDDPVVLKVKDSEKHDIGQVVIPLVKIKPRSTNPLNPPSSATNIVIGELEPTRKVSSTTGCLYYWIWAEEFYSGDDHIKSSKASILNSVNLHRSSSRISGHRFHRSARNKNDTSVQGSTLSMYSGVDAQDKKPWYKKNISKHFKKDSSGSSLISSRNLENSYSMTRSMNSLFPGTNDQHNYVSQNHGSGSFLGRDGSVLGVSSDISATNNAYVLPDQKSVPSVNSMNQDNELLQKPVRIGNRQKMLSPQPVEINKTGEPNKASIVVNIQSNIDYSNTVPSGDVKIDAVTAVSTDSPPVKPVRELISILKPVTEKSSSSLSSSFESDIDEIAHDLDEKPTKIVLPLQNSSELLEENMILTPAPLELNKYFTPDNITDNQRPASIVSCSPSDSGVGFIDNGSKNISKRFDATLVSLNDQNSRNSQLTAQYNNTTDYMDNNCMDSVNEIVSSNEETGEQAKIISAGSDVPEQSKRSISQIELTVESLKSELAVKCADLDRVSMELCKLRIRLLEAGQFEYLEKL